MISHPMKSLIFFIAIVLAAISVIGLYQHQNLSTNKLSKAGENKNLVTNESPKTAVKPVEKKSTGSQLIVTSRSLLGTWSKVRTQHEDHHYLGDGDWHLSVSFKENGRFIGDSKRYDNKQNPIDESLRGTYLIERGFIIAYKFDKPSPAAQKRLPELFAFWPNKQLGQQTFKFRDDFLILGHDGAKLWFHLKRKTDVEQSASTDVMDGNH